MTTKIKPETKQDKEHTKNRLYAPIFIETTLPKSGWIQGCIMCNANTSNICRYIDVNRDDIGYMVYCCRNCCISTEANESIKKEYYDIIYEYIEIYKNIIYEKVDTLMREFEAEYYDEYEDKDEDDKNI